MSAEVAEDAASRAAIRAPTGSAWRSAAYMFGSRSAIQIISVAKGIVVARLLGPTDLGAFILVAGVVGALEIASHPGLEDALVDSADERPRLWQAAWTFLVLRGAVISATVVLTAGPVAAWLNAPQVTPLLRVVAIVPFIRGFTSLSLAWRTRRVDLRPTATTELVANAVELVAGTLLTVLTRSAWGLVAAMVLGALSRTLWSYRYTGVRSRFVPFLREVRPLFGFSKWRVVSNLLYYVSTRADDLLVGRYLGVRPLGQYRTAYRLAHLPTTEIVSVVESVAFPALAVRARESPALAIATYPRYLVLTCGVAGPLAAVFAALAGPIIATLLGPEFAAAAVPLAIMCVGGYIRAVISTAGSLVLSLGRPALDAMMGTARAVVLVAGIIVLTPHGIVGAALASLLSLIAALPMWALSLHLVHAGPWRAVAVAAGRLPAAAAAGGAAWIAGRLPWPAPLCVVAGLLAACVAWLAVVAIADRPLSRELLSLVHRVRHRRTTTVHEAEPCAT